MKVSRRIEALSKLLEGEKYQSILDTCCDHGLIGLKIYEDHKDSFQEMILIDIIEPIIRRLDLEIIDTYIPSSFLKISTKVQCVKEISFSSQDLVIMAGVGANLILDAVISHKRRKQAPRHYLISAHTKHAWLRERLREEGLFLVKELMILEDNIHYDHMLLSFDSGAEIQDFNQTGEELELKDYYQRLKTLFEIKAQHGERWSEAKLKSLLSIYN